MISVYPVAQTGDMNTDPSQKSDPRLDLVNARLEGLPPVTIINAQTDPLREDGAMLADALRQAGVRLGNDDAPTGSALRKREPAGFLFRHRHDGEGPQARSLLHSRRTPGSTFSAASMRKC